MCPAGRVGVLRDGLTVEARINVGVVQAGSTDEMVYTVGVTLSLISHTLTLHPGYLLATGTPPGVGYPRTPPWLSQHSDVVDVEVKRIRLLRQPFVDNRLRHKAPAHPDVAAKVTR